MTQLVEPMTRNPSVLHSCPQKGSRCFLE